MRGYSYVGLIRKTTDLGFVGESLHYAPLVLVLEGDEAKRFGRGECLAISADKCGSRVVGSHLFAWGNCDESVADLLSLGHRRVVYVGADKPGRKTKAALAKLVRTGSDVVIAGYQIETVGRVDCEAPRSGTVDRLTDSGWELAPEPKPVPKTKKKKAAKAAPGSK